MLYRASSVASVILIAIGCSAVATTLSVEPMHEAEAFVCEKVLTCSRTDECENADGRILFVWTEAPDGVAAKDDIVLWASDVDKPHRLQRIDHAMESGAFDADEWGMSNYFFKVPEELKDRFFAPWIIRILVPEHVDGTPNHDNFKARIYQTLSSEYDYSYHTLSCSVWGAW